MREWRHQAEESETGRRLDQVLTEALPELTRSQIKRLCVAGLVIVNDIPVKAGHPLREGENILVRIPPPPEITPEPEDIPLNVVFEDEHLLVIDKPAGLSVHPGAGRHCGTLVNALLGRGTTLSPLGAPVRPGIVHRLDKNTSGLMVVAKTEAAHRVLSEDLAERVMTRRYWALVWGVPHPREDLIDANLARSRSDRRRMRVVHGRGKPARTQYRVISGGQPASAVALQLETGRTHQIRAHFRHLGHPVFGDPDYGGRGRRAEAWPGEIRRLAQKALDRIDRQALHAVRLGFRHPVTGEPMSWESPLPEDIAGAAAILRVPSSALTLASQENE